MDERRSRVHDDLRGLVRGDLLFHPLGRVPYARDGSLYEIDPLGVVVPESTDDVVALARYAAERRVPLHARGAGTGLAGESLGPGLVIDFSKHMRRVLEIGPDFVTVQAGASLDIVNRRLAPLGRMIGPDPGGSSVCTIGGMVGGNAAGARSLHYGTTADHVIGMNVVMADGESLRAEKALWPLTEDGETDARGRLVERVASLYQYYADAIAKHRPRTPRNRCGYALDGVLQADGVDLGRVIVGSEGTLALVTEVTMRTVPVPTAQAAVFVPFARLSDALAAIPDCLRDHPSACELVDWRSLSLARDAFSEIINPLPDEAESALVIEFLGDDGGDVERRVSSLAARLTARGGLAGRPVEALRRADAERLLHLRDLIRPLVMKMRGSQRALPFVEDLAVAVAALPDLIARLQNVLRAHGVNFILSAHAGHGQVHLRPLLDLADPDDQAKLEPIAEDVYQVVWDLGGTISGEHGCGLVRTQFLRRQYGDLFPLFQRIKETFDPQDLLNPGKIIGDDPHLMVQHLVRSPSVLTEETKSTETPGPALVLRWEGPGPVLESARCNGCGACRTLEPSLRICPTFRALRGESAAPRAKANLLRQVVAGLIDPRDWGSDEARELADLCVHCDLCRSECPAGVDVSSLMLEAKAAHVERHGLPLTEWMLSRIDVWSAWASRTPRLFNRLMASRSVRWALENSFGLSRHRRLPIAHPENFVKRAERLGLTVPRPHRPGPRVAYFVDLFANHFDQELAEAVVAVLMHAGVNVHVPRTQTGSGMAALVAGDVEHARELAVRNLRTLSTAVRDGYTIVCSEPTATLMLRREYLKLTDDLDAAVVAENTRDVGDFLAGLDARGQLPPRESAVRVHVGYHQPCHLRALEIGTPGLDLIRTVPGVEADWVDQGCSGMAGTFGMARRNFRDSLRIGRPLFRGMSDPAIKLGVTECGACRSQIEQGAHKTTLHPIKLLALSYGLGPNLRRHLDETTRDRK